MMEKILQGDFKMLAKTFYGLEEILAKELLQLGAKNIQPLNRAVAFTGDIGFMYKANYCLRTALKILVPIADFKITSADDLYIKSKEIEWETFFSLKQTFAIDAVVGSDFFQHSNYPSLKLKDAIADRFREKFNARPSVDADNPDLGINIYISGDLVTISLDSSGESLHKRGYREKTNLAPINEVLAAGLVLLSGWEYHQPLIDLMCGSGTIPIEAALYANNIPPGYFRDEFAFQKWEKFDAELWKLITESCLNKIKDFEVNIYGCEISRNVFRKAFENVNNAKVEDVIHLKNIDFKDFEPPRRRGVVIVNPPYGERMTKENDINLLYKTLGDEFKSKYDGYNVWLISSNEEALKQVGLRPSRKIKVFNGKLECRYMKYEMYSGTKKIHKISPTGRRPRIEE